MNIVFSTSFWLGLPLLLIATALSWLVFKQTKSALVAVLRWLTFSLLILLLLSPFIKSIHETVSKPILVIAQDNSKSVAKGFKTLADRQRYLEALNAFSLQMADQFDVKLLGFGERATPMQQFDFSESLTDVSACLNSIENNYGNDNIAAVVLASDGIVNHGSSPLYQLQKFAAPVFTIALGDTVPKKDLKIQALKVPDYVTTGNAFLVDIEVTAKKTDNENTLLQITLDDSLVFKQQLQLNNNHTSQRLQVQLNAPVKTGQHKITAHIAAVKGESNISNNNAAALMRVIDSKDNILILAGSAHPDVAALKSALESKGNRAITCCLEKDFNGNLSPYALVIACQIKSKSILKQLELQSQVPIWEVGCFVNASSLLNDKWEHQLNELFSIFALSKDFSKITDDMPPLTAFVGNQHGIDPGAIVMFKTDRATNKHLPICYFNSLEGHKMAFFNCAGWWRWRLHEFQMMGNQDHFDAWVQKTANYLISKDANLPFQVQHPAVFEHTAVAQLRAQLQNAAGESVSNAEITLTLFDSQQKKFGFTFSKNDRGEFECVLGKLQPGNYHYQATAKVNNTHYETRGNFSVIESNLEDFEDEPDLHLLNQMAKLTGGQQFGSNDWQQLSKRLNDSTINKRVIFTETKLSSLVDFKWPFAVILLLLTAEWVVRRRNGL